MIYFYSKHNLFWRHFCSLARHIWTRLMVEWTIKWLFFSKVCPKVASYGQTEKKSLVGVTGEEIFQFNWRIGRKSNKLHVSLGATLGLQRLKNWVVKGWNIINLDNFRSNSAMIYSYNALAVKAHILFDIGDILRSFFIS